MNVLKLVLLEVAVLCAGVLGNDFGNSVFEILQNASHAPPFSDDSTCMQALAKVLSTKQIFTYLDASGKPGAGLEMGNLVWLGNYDECVGIDGAHFCTMKNIEVTYQKQSLPLQMFGLCLPDVCDVSNAIDVLKFLKGAANATLQKYGVQISVNPLKVGMYGPNAVCYKKDKTYSSGTITMIVISGLIAALCLIGTAIDAFQLMMKEDELEEDTIEILNDGADDDNAFVKGNAFSYGQQQQQQQQQISMHTVNVDSSNNKIVEFFLCFSLIKNSKTLFDTTVPAGAITCLNGIRTISIMWVVMGHFVIFTFQQGLANPKMALSWVSRFSMQPLLNGGLAVDTFFLLSGVLVSYLSMRRFEKNGKLPLVRYYVHRYIRLTPSYAYVIFFSTYIFPVLSDGPDWTTGTQEQHCKDYWWTNLLYINNFYPTSVLNICLSVSWYLANDMQFYVISPIILWCIYRFKWRGVGVVGAIIIVLHFLTNGILMHEENASPLFFEPASPSFSGPHSQVMSYQNYIYTKPYCRVMVYFMGLVLGYVFHRKCNFLPKRTSMYRFIGWALFVPLIFVITYGPYTSTRHLWVEAENQWYGLLFRIAWALCIGWVIFACHNKYGGLVNDFLSWRAFIPLSRLTYGTYLIHLSVIFLISNSQRAPLYLSELSFSIHYTAVTIFSFFAAYILSVCIEYPVFNLEKLFLHF